MLDIRELEQKWIRYKIKKYAPLAIFSISLVTITIVLSTLVFSKKESSLALEKKEQKQKTNLAKNSNKLEPKQQKKEQNKPIEKNRTKINKSQKPSEVIDSTTKIAQTVAITNTEYKASTQPTKVLHPSLDFLKKMKENSVFPQTQDLSPSDYDASYKTSSNIDRSTISESKDTNSKEEKEKIKIKVSKTSKKDLEEIIKRFKKSNNPILGVFIAKKYYQMQKYRKSYNYALLTNQIDSSIEDSWIIFAKSLVKLGQKERAIKTLKAYIQNSQSNKAKILLNNIMTGKFR
ncbi:Transformation system protein [hydrothermal vent metagenome]|uniref:Transformation system protein n=1 Tax=hydrothermal vent metagenome TaxID=652676 RepID=A0A1W1B991_9ZZZZ